MKHLIAAALTSLVGLFAQAQDIPLTPATGPWELGVTLGTTGLGLEGAYNINPNFRARAGFEGMIPFSVPMHFSVTNYGGEGGGVNSDNFNRLQELMKSFTGIEVDDRVTMDGKPRMYNAKVLVDWRPWAQKGWRVTAGFYWGTHKIATAKNTMGEMPALLAINIYNRMHDDIVNGDLVNNPIYDNGETVVYLPPETAEELKARFEAYGLMGIHVGDFKNGNPYMMTPGKDGMVKANAFVNSFKPYVGIGYDGKLNATPHITLGFDLGMLIWGGTPNIYTHDGVNLSKDMKSVSGKPGDYVDVIKAFKVYPVLNFRAAYCF